jgi:hypothetical protein
MVLKVIRSTASEICRKEGNMAAIYLNHKNGTIVSFKFKAYLGRDEKGSRYSNVLRGFPIYKAYKYHFVLVGHIYLMDNTCKFNDFMIQ